MNGSHHTVSGDDIVKLKPEILDLWRQLSLDTVTRPAAFGVCCRRLMDELGCNLHVAALLMDCWVTECTLQ